MQDLLARLPVLHGLFEESLETPAKCHEAWVSVLSPETHTDIDVLPGRFGLPRLDDLKGAFSLEPAIEVRRKDKHNFLGAVDHLFIRLTHSGVDSMKRIIPPLLPGRSRDAFMIES